MAETQNFQNHVRWYPLVHFVVTPLLFINFFWQIYRLYQEQSVDRAESLMMAIVFLLMSVAARFRHCSGRF